MLISERAHVAVPPDQMALQLGEEILEDPLPLHYYGVADGTKLTVGKPYVGVTIRVRPDGAHTGCHDLRRGASLEPLEPLNLGCVTFHEFA